MHALPIPAQQTMDRIVDGVARTRIGTTTKTIQQDSRQMHWMSILSPWVQDVLALILATRAQMPSSPPRNFEFSEVWHKQHCFIHIYIHQILFKNRNKQIPERNKL